MSTIDTALSAPELRSLLETAFRDNERLGEALSNVARMLKAEDVGWATLSGNGDDGGLSLDELKDWSKQLRESVVGNVHMKRGARLRCSYVWEGGIHYENIRKETRGRGLITQELIDDPYNQKNFFSNTAREQRETCLYTDSIVFYLGDDKTRLVESVSLESITGEYRNPENGAEIWAYRREWDSYNAQTGKTTQRKEWYFTDVFKSKSVPTLISVSGEVEKVNEQKTIFDGSVNTQTGWAYGVPDALPGLAWAKLYRDFMVNGKIMSDALAMFAFKATGMTAKSNTKANLTMASSSTPGSTVSVAGVADFNPMQSAGKGYDFSSGTPLLAAFSTSIEASVIHVSANPGDAGSSYGSAATLDLPTRLAVKSRRQWHVDFDKRVMRWMGAPEAIIWFEPTIEATDLLRKIQSIVTKWDTGLYSAKEIKAMLEEVSIENVTVPDGVMLPNNFESWARNDVDPSDNPNATAPATTPGAPGQGRSGPAGDTNLGDDLRTDGIGEAMQALQKRVAKRK